MTLLVPSRWIKVYNMKSTGLGEVYAPMRNSGEEFSPYGLPPSFALYDDNAFYHLVDHLEEGKLAEISSGSGCLLKQERLLSRPADIEHRVWADLQKYTYFDSRVHKVIDLFRSLGDSQYFESLDDAFIRAPDAKEGCGWIYVRDTFTLTNLGTVTNGFLLSDYFTGPTLARLASEQRLVFRLPILDSYSPRDDYFKAPKRPWHATMILPSSRFKGIRVGHPQFWRWHDSLKYYLQSTHGTVLLNVVGSYFRSGLNVAIVPYVVWA